MAKNNFLNLKDESRYSLGACLSSETEQVKSNHHQEKTSIKGVDSLFEFQQVHTYKFLLGIKSFFPQDPEFNTSPEANISPTTPSADVAP